MKGLVGRVNGARKMSAQSQEEPGRLIAGDHLLFLSLSPPLLASSDSAARSGSRVSGAPRKVTLIDVTLITRCRVMSRVDGSEGAC